MKDYCSDFTLDSCIILHVIKTLFCPMPQTSIVCRVYGLKQWIAFWLANANYTVYFLLHTFLTSLNNDLFYFYFLIYKYAQNIFAALASQVIWCFTNIYHLVVLEVHWSLHEFAKLKQLFSMNQHTTIFCLLGNGQILGNTYWGYAINTCRLCFALTVRYGQWCQLICYLPHDIRANIRTTYL